MHLHAHRRSEGASGCIWAWRGQGGTHKLLSSAACLLQVHDSPLKVAVEHLRDQPYNPSEDHLKATTLEIVSTLKELLHLHPLYNEQLRSFAGVQTFDTRCCALLQTSQFEPHVLGSLQFQTFSCGA